MEPEDKSLEIRKVLLETMIFRFHVKFRGCTPWKTNMSPENQWLEDVFPIEIIPFLGDIR